MLMKEVASVASSMDKGILLQSYEAPDSVDFYERLKMHPVSIGLRENVYRFTKEETKKFASTGFANKTQVYEHGGPGSGRYPAGSTNNEGDRVPYLDDKGIQFEEGR